MVGLMFSRDEDDSIRASFPASAKISKDAGLVRDLL